MKTLARLVILALVLAGMPAGHALAQSSAEPSDYPNRNVTIIAPSAPGGLFSLFARLIAHRLEQRLGKPFIVENRPGAGTVVGAVSAVRSAHDGYTLMVANSTTLSINPTLHKKLPYDPADLIPITLIARIPQVLVVNAALPVHSIADLVKLAKATPGGLSYGTSGAGTAQHLDAEMLKSVLGIPMTHVPYKGMAPAIADVAGGHIPMMFSVIPIALPAIHAGKVRMIGVTTTVRIEPIPEVPPLAEIGVPGFNASTWFMLVAPAKTPRAIVDRLHAEMRDFTSDEAVRKELINQGLMPVPSPPPAELQRFVQSETERFGKVVTQAGLAGSQ
jgi:tripartite-type tricarboxylate transporter receptor subunit TctC